MAEIREILRCYCITGSKKETARTLGCAKGTVRRYVRWAAARGYLASPELPSEALLAREWREDDKGRAVVRSALEPHRETIKEWLDDGIILTRIQEMLIERHSWAGSYETLKRFTLPLRKDQKVCIRIEVPPGTEAQVDFGYAGLSWDSVEKRLKKAWLFLMTLSHSRHAYGEFVFAQDLATWISCHARAFEFFGGVPRKIVLDNLKAAIIKAAVYDPMVNRTYRECAEHYGFIISPCLPGMPEHKGKVERGVPYVRKSFLAGRDFRDKDDANVQLLDWLVETAGTRIHGTTKRQPIVVFDIVEKNALMPLPEFPFILTTWKEALVHKDCHVTAEGSFYSVPHRLRGETVLVQIAGPMVRIFHHHELIATHIRATRPGTRRTIASHYPPKKMAYMEQTPQWCLARAKEIGPNTYLFVDELFTRAHPLDALRRVQGVLALERRYSVARLEATCQRALHFGAFTYQAVKRILEKDLDQQPFDRSHGQDGGMTKQRRFEFERPIEEFVQHIKEATTWNSSIN